MAIVLIEYQIKVVDDEVIKKLYGKTIEDGSDLAEVPELPGVCFHNVISVSKEGEILVFGKSKDRIDTATLGDSPTAVMLVRRGDTVRMNKEV